MHGGVGCCARRRREKKREDKTARTRALPRLLRVHDVPRGRRRPHVGVARAPRGGVLARTPRRAARARGVGRGVTQPSRCRTKRRTHKRTRGLAQPHDKRTRHETNAAAVVQLSALVASVVRLATSMAAVTPLTVALDWTPNTNHIGFYVVRRVLPRRVARPRRALLCADATAAAAGCVGPRPVPARAPRQAKAKGWYADAALDVTLLSTHHDGYKRTPASRVADGSATFAVTPSETVVSSATPPATGAPKPKLVAVAALQAKTTSAVVTLKSSGRDTPAKLDGANYASYGARYEGRIVQELIKKAGGTGVYTESVPPMLGIWNTLLEGNADATWVFMGYARTDKA
jgi:ABC-type nitrate/sulfonate/bicarbonate transport system substrate-binding protein